MKDTITDKRQERKAASRARILHEAAAAMRAQGVSRVSVQEVMARAGMTVGGFYAHFQSKDDLLAHAITQMFDERYSAFWSDLDRAAPEVMLKRFVEAYLSMRHRDAPDRGCPIPVLAAEAHRLPPPARQAFNAGMERLVSGIVHLLRCAGIEHSEVVARSVIAEMSGALSLARAQSEPATAVRQLDASRALVMKRIGATPAALTQRPDLSIT